MGIPVLAVRMHNIVLTLFCGTAMAAAFAVLAWQVFAARRVGSRPVSPSRIISICAYCRKILDEDGTWGCFEEYMLGHFKMRSSHGICPDCVAKQIQVHPAESRLGVGRFSSDIQEHARKGRSG